MSSAEQLLPIVEREAEPERVQALLDAVLAIGSDLDLQTVLRRIAEAAVTLVDARYGALGIVGEQGGLTQFLTVGVDEATHARIGQLPRGGGILGLLIRDPKPLRLDDLGSHPATVGFPAHHPAMTSFLGVPIRVRGVVFGNLYLTEKQGAAAFDDGDEAVVVALASAAGVAIEHARLYETAGRRAEWLRAGAQISTALLSGSEPREVLQTFTDRARELAGGDFACVVLPAGDQHLVVEVAAGERAGELVGTALVASEAPFAQLFTDGVPRLQHGEGTRALLGRVPVTRGLYVALGPPGDVRAVLVVGAAHDAASVASTVLEELQAFAVQASVTFELGERRQDAERVVVYEDRDRIARDLHDLVIQRLFATGMQLESAVRLIERPEAVQRVRHAVDDLDATIREIRSTIYALHEEDQSASASLRTRILKVVDDGSRQLGFAPSVRMSGLVDTVVSPVLGEHLLAVLREALSNAARHAGASRVEVDLSVDDDVRLLVSDDGRGIAPGRSRRSGLANLTDRAVEVGGSFEAGARTGGGALLRWTAPLVQPA